MPTAIVSVSDKTGVAAFARGLSERGWQIVSTGGTASELMEAGVPVTGVSELTRHQEMLGGRVKTLHPVVHAGILARRSVPEDMEQLRERDIEPIDLVAVNLYPFRKTVSRETVTLAEALEQIDVGGPTLLRAAAKNHSWVWPVCDPADYDHVLAALDADPGPPGLRRRLAEKVFRHTASYDAAIAGYLDPAAAATGESGELPADLFVSLTRVQRLRYGENPDQGAAFYRDASGPLRGIPALEQLHGKALSYNNLLDVDGALAAIAPFAQGPRAACAIVKHTTPCGLALGRSPLEAYEKALACDPVSAFGSVIAFTEPVTETVAEALASQFVECVVAPGYAGRALQLLEAKKNVRILRPESLDRYPDVEGHLWTGRDLRGVAGGLLIQSSPAPVRVGEDGRSGSVPTRREPTEAERRDLEFGWAAIQSVKSNAILLARDGATIGIGAGQMSRVDAVQLAVDKARAVEHELTGCVLASDAFFPFRDGIDAAAAVGVTAVIQPGGSVRDDEVVGAADEHGIAMVLTGRRLFRH